jgi:hypothetical protein
MTTWTSDELNKIGKAEELQIASLRRDGTLRKHVIIWVVRVGDDLYVRSVYGRTSAWFRGTQVRTKATSGLAESTKTWHSWMRLTPMSTNRSTPPIKQNTAATLQASSATSRALRRDPRQSNFCRAQQALSSTANAV